MYLAAFNVGESRAHYSLNVTELSGDSHVATYDYFADRVLDTGTLEGDLEPAQGHYYVIMPLVGQLHLLGFSDKYITVSGRQVIGIEQDDGRLTVRLRLPSP